MNSTIVLFWNPGCMMKILGMHLRIKVGAGRQDNNYMCFKNMYLGEVFRERANVVRSIWPLHKSSEQMMPTLTGDLVFCIVK